MLRILHTADWQLGLRPRQAGAVADDLAQLRFRSAERVVALARERKVDAVVLAGDTFDHPDVDESILVRAIDLLESLAPIPVLVLPGNHDPLLPGGLWYRSAWKRVADQVRILDRQEEIELEGDLAIYACPLTERRSRRDPTAWLPPRAAGDTRARVAIAHGALSTLQVRSQFPIDLERLLAGGFDWVALGDWHGLTLLDRVGYPGTIEPTGFGEQNPGHVLVVDIEPGSATAPRVDAIDVASTAWHAFDSRIDDPTDLAPLHALVRRFSSVGGPDDERAGSARATAGHRLVLRVSGSLGQDREVQAEAEQTRLRLEAVALYLDWRLREPLPETPLPAGLLDDVDRELASLLEGDEEGDRATVEEARRLLRRLAEAPA